MKVSALGFQMVIRDDFNRLVDVVPQDYQVTCQKCLQPFPINVCNNLQCPICGGNVRDAI